MFANLLQRASARPDQAHAYEAIFVHEVTVQERLPRSRRVELTLITGWGLIGLKWWLICWLIAHYQVPFDPIWINGPTGIFAALCTWVYLRRI